MSRLSAPGSQARSASPRVSSVASKPSASPRPAMGSDNSEDIPYYVPTTAKGIASAGRAAKRGNNVNVSVRVRPLGANKAADKGVETPAVEVTGDNEMVLTRGAGETKKYTYDNVFDAGQDEVYDCIGKPMLKTAFDGYNVTLFAYGQTGSGKTHSIMGPDNADETNEGIVGRFLRDMFGIIEYKMNKDNSLAVQTSMSMVEVYNEQIQDLLNPGEKNLPLREDNNRRVYVDGVTTRQLTSRQSAVDTVFKGFNSRQVAATQMNARSSRSHCIIRINMVQMRGGHKLESTIHIVDLAGSERQSKTGAEGTQLEQAKFINLSLTTLGRVLSCLADGGIPPLRDSQLTRMLSESFGGNARTWMLACVSASMANGQETMSTLDYAAGAKKIVNKAKVNEQRDDRDKVKALQLEVKLLTERNQQLEEEIRQLREGGGGVSNGACGATGGQLVAGNGFDQGITRGLSFSGNLFIGRVRLSLENCVMHYDTYNTLPLLVQREDFENATLTIKTWAVAPDGEELRVAYPDKETAFRELKGKRFDCCISVISASGIPEEYTKRIECQYVFHKRENKPVKAPETYGKNPKWDFQKRFAWESFDEKLGNLLCRDDAVTFEVMGYPS